MDFSWFLSHDFEFVDFHVDSKPAVTDPDAPGVSAPELQLAVTPKLRKSNFY